MKCRERTIYDISSWWETGLQELNSLDGNSLQDKQQ